MVKFHIAIRNLGTLEINVLSTYVLKYCAGLDTAYITKKINLDGDEGYQNYPLVFLVNVVCRHVGTL